MHIFLQNYSHLRLLTGWKSTAHEENIQTACAFIIIFFFSLCGPQTTKTFCDIRTTWTELEIETKGEWKRNDTIEKKMQWWMQESSRKLKSI